MRHSIDELLGIAYRHYPRGMSSDHAGHRYTEEHRRLVAARRQAGAAHDPWRAMLRRLGAQLPEHLVTNRSLHLPMGDWDACYSGSIDLSRPASDYPLPLPDPDALPASVEGPPSVDFLVSFLCPYYIIYGSRYVDDLEATEAALRAPPRETVTVWSGNTAHILPISVVTPEISAEAGRQNEQRRQDLLRQPLQRRVIDFEPSPDEQPYAAALTREIEATFGCERMPPEIGNVLVPDVATNNRALGEARLYDCLLSDQW
jgi:hypothetical protein